jgi:hypothetical protein
MQNQGQCLKAQSCRSFLDLLFQMIDADGAPCKGNDHASGTSSCVFVVFVLLMLSSRTPRCDQGRTIDTSACYFFKLIASVSGKSCRDWES